MIAADWVILPSGCWVQGDHQRRARLRPLNGADEMWLGDRPAGPCVSFVSRAGALLSRCVERLGTVEPVSPALMSELTVGDREALLLHLRRLTLGDRIQATVRCPASGCGAVLDLDLRVADLLLPPYGGAAPEYEFADQTDAGAVRVRFRLPTGADQEAAAEVACGTVRTGTAADAEVEAKRGMRSAVAFLLRRCVREVWQGGELVEDVPPLVAPRLAQRMSELDPQAELMMRARCPECGAAFSGMFDATRFV
ncbi:MAG: hypothetical protein JXB13_22675, partial [Phycisphaerae bacterium]|nr:hypothetical protein [Phycisphaerae bacterium]